MIRRFMHHTDLTSQEAYTEAGREECLHHIRLAVDRLNTLQSDDKTDIVRVSQSDFARLLVPYPQKFR